MPVPSSPYIDIMAQGVADYMIKRGWWENCEPEKIRQLADNEYELQKWWKDCLFLDTGIASISVFPENPKKGQVALLAHKGIAYRYVYLNDKQWGFVEARRAELF